MTPVRRPGRAQLALDGAVGYLAIGAPGSRQLRLRWAAVLLAGVRQGFCGPALQLAIQAQLPAWVPAVAQDWTGDGIACASRVASLEGVQA
mgnify:CR=1 FL=1